MSLYANVSEINLYKYRRHIVSTPTRPHLALIIIVGLLYNGIMAFLRRRMKILGKFLVTCSPPSKL